MPRILPLALLILLVAPGCTKKTETTSTSETAARNEYVQASEQRLAALDAKMDSLRAGLDRADDATKTAIQKSLDELQVERQNAQTKLDEVRMASEQTWQKARGELADMLDALDRKLDEARTRLR